MHIRGMAWRKQTGASHVPGWAIRREIARSRNPRLEALEGQAVGGEGARLSGSPGSAEEASREATGGTLVPLHRLREQPENRLDCPLEGRNGLKWRAC